MSIIADILRNFQRAPLVDLDTPHEPSARSEISGSQLRGQPTAPTSPGAVGIHPSQWPTDWGGIRRDLAHLRSVLQEALLWLDEIDPAVTGLAAVADVTDLDGKRKGRQSRD